MSTNITVSLPDAICKTAQVWAAQAGRALPDFLADAIEASLVPLGDSPPPVRDWSDADVLAAAEASLPPYDDRRLSELLALKREGAIGGDGRNELTMLMQKYQEGLIRKAAALQEAVRRGLREPLAS
jgi:hypothetical protein